MWIPLPDIDALDSVLKDIETICKEGRDSRVKTILKELVPEYHYLSVKDHMPLIESIATLEDFKPVTIH